MPRVKSNVARLKRKNKVMKLAKGYWGGRRSTPTATGAAAKGTSGASGSPASTRPRGSTSCRTAAS